MLLKDTKDWLKSHKEQLDIVLEAQFVELLKGASMYIAPEEILQVEVCDDLVKEGIGTFNENGRFVPNLQHKYFKDVLNGFTGKYNYIKSLIENGIQKYDRYYISSEVELWPCHSRDDWIFIHHWVSTKYPCDYIRVHTRDANSILQNDHVYASFRSSN